MEDFAELSPAEVATLWLSTDLDMGSKEERTILASNATLTLMVILAEGFTRLGSTNLADRALTEISNYSRDLVAHIAVRGNYVRYDQPVRRLLEKLDNIGFPILPPEKVLDLPGEKRTKTAVSYEYGLTQYQKAVNSLEEGQLIIDPPWYKTPLAIGSLIVLLGSVPLEINVKTVKGKDVVTSMKMDAKFWSYESIENGEAKNIHINIKIAKFIDKAVENLGTGFIDAWKEQNPSRVESLENETQRISKQ